MKAPEPERRDWFMIPLILGIGFLCVIVAGQLALRFSPSWKLNTNMDSKLDPNSDFLTRRPSGLIEPVDPAILTEPVWINLFLTPGASLITGTPFPRTTIPSSTTFVISQTPFKTSTPIVVASVTTINVALTSPTNTFVYYPPTSTSQPKPTATSKVVPIYTATPTATVTSSWTATPTPPQSPTTTSTLSSPLPSTATGTATATQIPTYTADPSEPDFGGPDGNTTTLGNGAWIEFNLSGFSLDGDSAWDTVFYEMEEASAAGKIHLGAVKIEVYDQTTAAWYEVYHWGDGAADINASYNNGNSEPDGFPIDQSLLYGPPPLNTGIAIDIDMPTLGQGGSIGDLITIIRITSLSNTHCEIDSLQMLR